MARWQGGNSIPPPERGRSTAFASLRSKCCPVGVRRLARAFGDHRGLELTPTRLPPNKSGIADLPLSGGGIAQLAAPLSPCATARPECGGSSLSSLHAPMLISPEVLYAAFSVVGSIILRTSVILVAGKPLISACLRMIASSWAR